MTNFTKLNIDVPSYYDSTFDYASWCVQQQVHFQSSVNQAMLFFIGVTWGLLMLASVTYKFEKFSRYHESVLHMARLSLVFVVAIWFLFVYLGIIWFE